jgi:two-component sensor histidine kinase
LSAHVRDGLADAPLIVSELVTNSLLHASLPDGATVRICARLAEGVLRLEVEDRGAGGAGRRQPDLDRGGGFGLNIVDALAERWGISRKGGTLVWVELAMFQPTG